VIPAKISAALDALPSELRTRSGSVFYTGRSAFSEPSPLYILGLNPGGDPVLQAQETIERHIDAFRSRLEPWSAYADESWNGAKPGTWGMQPRVLHMLSLLNLDPRATPASNVIFARTRTEAALKSTKAALLDLCWPVHDAVISSLGVRVIVCLGGTAGLWVRDRISADALVDTFEEQNARGWKSVSHRSTGGITVVTVSHPGRADWTNALADPTPLVRTALAESA
jgi:hypothetical protein